MKRKPRITRRERRALQQPRALPLEQAYRLGESPSTLVGIEREDRELLVEEARQFLARPGNRPGCYNHSDFIALEKRDATIIEEYARFIVTRPRLPEEDQRTNDIIRRLTKCMTEKVTVDELRRRCGEVTHTLLRMLEQVGVWSFAVRGSARFSFEKSTGLRDRFFYTSDIVETPDGMAGHVWLVAPPYSVVDFTAQAQQWQHGEGKHIPRVVMAESAPRVAPVDRDRQCLSWLPARSVQADRTTIVYQPEIITVPTELNFEGFSLVLGGHKAADFWTKVAEPAIAAK